MAAIVGDCIQLLNEVIQDETTQQCLWREIDSMRNVSEC